MAAKNTTTFFGGVASYAPPARVRVRKGFINLAPGSLRWSARRGIAGRSDVGAIALEQMARLRCDPDGSVVVAYWEGRQERQLAFWPDPRQLLSANDVLEAIERWAGDAPGAARPLSAEEDVREAFRGIAEHDPALLERIHDGMTCDELNAYLQEREGVETVFATQNMTRDERNAYLQGREDRDETLYATQKRLSEAIGRLRQRSGASGGGEAMSTPVIVLFADASGLAVETVAALTTPTPPT